MYGQVGFDVGFTIPVQKNMLDDGAKSNICAKCHLDPELLMGEVNQWHTI